MTQVAQDRASALAVGLPWRVYPIPDGTISGIDRPHVCNCYRGIELLTVRKYSAAFRFVMPFTLNDGELVLAQFTFEASLAGASFPMNLALDYTTNSAAIPTYANWDSRTRTSTTVEHTVGNGSNVVNITSLFNDVTGNLGAISSGSGVTILVDAPNTGEMDRYAAVTSYEDGGSIPELYIQTT